MRPGNDDDSGPEEYWAEGFEPARPPPRSHTYPQSSPEYSRSFGGSARDPSTSGNAYTTRTSSTQRPRASVQDQFRELDSVTISNEHLRLPPPSIQIPFSHRVRLRRDSEMAEAEVSLDGCQRPTAMRLIIPAKTISAELYEGGPTRGFPVPDTKLIYKFDSSNYSDAVGNETRLLADLTLHHAIDQLYGNELNLSAKKQLSGQFLDIARNWIRDNLSDNAYYPAQGSRSHGQGYTRRSETYPGTYAASSNPSGGHAASGDCAECCPDCVAEARMTDYGRYNARHVAPSDYNASLPYGRPAYSSTTSIHIGPSGQYRQTRSTLPDPRRSRGRSRRLDDYSGDQGFYNGG
ncbi:uncharacterized protein I303_107318 [Kwoniella dejecticola CBS 10117]|uniref:Uncharacterized protein n=1 Tax=Kwoniella dejecticola CBS 10117 TaxID=1296121 RepID=A0A1A5ZZC4_9TREE|nr:uncharacterized protein I303_06722 [Kwoniella dejecticola CBS 10117]OBR83163.1 hypothetical protein I303_06722 [Kwoniella dejecticola CBS 10117]